LAGGLGAAYAIGLAGYAAGLAASASLDLPTGAAIVCGLALSGATAYALRVTVGRSLSARISP